MKRLLKRYLYGLGAEYERVCSGGDQSILSYQEIQPAQNWRDLQGVDTSSPRGYSSHHRLLDTLLGLQHKAAILAEQNEKELQGPCTQIPKTQRFMITALHQKEQDAKNIRIKRFAAAMLTNRTEGALRVTFSSLK